MIVNQFALFYYSAGTTHDWSHELTHTDALLIALGTLTTAGAPGMTPVSEYARRLMAIQMAVDLLAFTLVAAVAADVFSKRRQQP